MTVFGRSNDFFAFYKTKCARPENRTRLRGFALFFQTFKGNQAMKLGQLIENKMRNIFHTSIVVERLCPDPFLKT